MIAMRKSTHGFPLLSHDKYGALLGGRSSSIRLTLEWGERNDPSDIIGSLSNDNDDAEDDA